MRNVISKYGYVAVRQTKQWDVYDIESGERVLVGSLRKQPGKYRWVPSYSPGQAYESLEDAILNLAAENDRTRILIVGNKCPVECICPATIENQR